MSNLSYVSKLVKRAVCNQLMEYAEKTGNLEEMQSAYRMGHSTETALLKVKTDILNNMDQRRVTFLVLLDLLAAFDLVSFKLLLNCLHYRFGVTGTVLKWIASYLTNRTQRVKIDDMESDPVTLKWVCLREVYLVQSCILFLQALLATFQGWGQAQGHTALTIMDMLMTHKTTTLLVL